MLEGERGLDVAVGANRAHFLALAIHEPVDPVVGVGCRRGVGEHVEPVGIGGGVVALEPHVVGRSCRLVGLHGNAAVRGEREHRVLHAHELGDLEVARLAVFRQHKSFGGLARIVVLGHVDHELQSRGLVAGIVVVVPVVGA